MTQRFNRWLTLVVLLILAVCAAMPSAQAQPQYPENMGVVCDVADVFSSETVEDIKAFHATLLDKTGVGFYVVTVHFLDGQDIRTYAQTLFARWGLGENDLLLLMAVGEDTFYSVAGSSLVKVFAQDTQQHLLSSYLEKNFMALKYNEAIASYIPALSSVLAKQYNKTITLPERMAASQPQAQATAAATATPWSESWESVLDTALDTALDSIDRVFGGSTSDNRQNQESVLTREDKNSGISLGSTLVLAIVLWLIFGKKSRRRDGRRNGCGCSPLGWLFAAFGLQKFFKRR